MSMANLQEGNQGQIVGRVGGKPGGVDSRGGAGRKGVVRGGKRYLRTWALQIGHAAIEQLLALQGDGRSWRERGHHGWSAVCSGARNRRNAPCERCSANIPSGPTCMLRERHEAIELRPVDARLSLPPGCPSYFFEEFSQYFCVDQAFGQASQGLATVLRQEVSVNTLEHINRRWESQAEGFLDRLPTPPAKKEGELLIFTADGKGVPLVKEDAECVCPPSTRSNGLVIAAWQLWRRCIRSTLMCGLPSKSWRRCFATTGGRGRRIAHNRNSNMSPRVLPACVRILTVKLWESNGTIEAFIWADEQIACAAAWGRNCCG